MSHWDERQERNARHLFVSRRLDMAPPILAVSLMFVCTWLCAWLTSAVLLASGMRSLPLRYGLAFCVAYLSFFLWVRIWCDFAKREPDKKNESSFSDLPADGEGCLWIVLIFAVSLAMSGLFAAIGGYGLLLEVAFEVAFAGTVVRGIGRQSMLGNWPAVLLRRTWWMAIILLVLLTAFASAMQRAAPETTTIASAYKSIKAKQSK